MSINTQLQNELEFWEKKGFTVKTTYDAATNKTIGTIIFEEQVIYQYESDRHFKHLNLNEPNEQKDFVYRIVLGKLQVSQVWTYTLKTGESQYILEENMLEALNILVYGQKIHPNEIAAMNLYFAYTT